MLNRYRKSEPEGLLVEGLDLSEPNKKSTDI